MGDRRPSKHTLLCSGITRALNFEQEANPFTGAPFASIADSVGPILENNDSASIRSALVSEYYITISTEEIPLKIHRLGRLCKFFSAGGKLPSPFIDYSYTEWFITFGDNEKAAVECFEEFLLEEFEGMEFGMELFGKDGELLMKSKKEILQTKNKFDENWIGFELLKRLDAYVAV